MCARFTVLSDTPMPCAISGCVIPLSRNNTIWMRSRCAGGIFQCRAVFNRRTSAFVHLIICPSESDGGRESCRARKKHCTNHTHPLRPQKSRFRRVWKWYQEGLIRDIDTYQFSPVPRSDCLRLDTEARSADLTAQEIVRRFGLDAMQS